MKKTFFLDIAKFILNNDWERFTGGMAGAVNELRQTKRDFGVLTLIICLFCLLSFVVRILLF